MKEQRHNIQVRKNKYQIIYRDAEIKIKARFYWDEKNIFKGDFNLKNYKTGKNKFKLHKVRFCNERNKLEAFISSHVSFERTSYKLYDEPTEGMSFEKQKHEYVEFLARVALDSTDNQIPVCDSDKPDDKDGSILIGVGLI